MTRPLCLASFLLLSVGIASAQGTHLWSQSSAQDFERGTPDGVGISSLGRLESAPEARSVLNTGSTFVWSVAADAHGDAYLATGTPAKVLRVTPAGAQKTLFTTKELTVQVVRTGPDGSLYAATLPSARVYRLDPSQADQDEATATVVFDPAQTAEKPKYVWDLAFDKAGSLYVATGAPGMVYRVALPKAGHLGKPELFYASDEPHIRALLFSPSGALFAGSDGSGLVYRIAPDGKGFVIFEAQKREVTALALGRAGQLYVAAVGEHGHSPLPPLPVTGAATVTTTITIVPPGSVQAFNGNSVIPDGSDVYEIPPASQGVPAGQNGSTTRQSAEPVGHQAVEDAPHRLWSSHDDILYALRDTTDGLLAASGNHGHVYRIAEDGTYADLAHLEASQVTGFADSPAGLYAATANTGKLYLLSHAAALHGSYLSDVFDAQVHSLWGRAEVLSAGSYQLYARTGNVENPLRGWTDWQPVTPAAQPNLTAARYLQWKAILAPGATITSVGINYLPANVAPVIDDLMVAPGTRATAQGNQSSGPQQVFLSFPGQQSNSGFEQSAAASSPLAAMRDKSGVTARWAAHDENGDDLIFALYYRGEHDGEWRLLKDKVTERFYSFDASLLPDGPYRIKLVASDAPSHPPGEALTADRESPVFLIETSTPQVTGLTATVAGSSLHITATATDVATPIARAEYSIDAGPWQYVEPAGRLSDALREQYDFTAPVAPAARAAGPHTVTLRVFDRYENAAAAEATAR